MNIAGTNIASWARFGFLTLPDYSMIAVTNAIEACRMANRCLGRDVYEWSLFAMTETPVPASNGMAIAPTRALDWSALPDILFVCGGVDIRAAVTPKLRGVLRRVARAGVPLGALCTGSFALAEAGLLDGYRCAVHWEDAPIMREEFPDVELANEMFVLDRNRLTCTGGVAPLDMMLFLIEARLGRVIAEHVSVTFLVERIRGGGERQPIDEHDRVTAQPLLAKAMAMIEDRLIGGRVGEKSALTEIAEALGMSTRGLQRLFHAELGESPAAFIKALRLKRAQAMLRSMKLPVTEVAMACGFSSSAYFASAYRDHFGYPPRAERPATRARAGA